MKGLSVLNKIVFAINIPFTVLLFFACLSPHVSTKALSFLPFFGLGVPVLVFANLLFFGYWSLKRKQLLLVSFSALFFGYFALETFFQLRYVTHEVSKDDLTLLSFNVRQFNKYGELDSETVFEDIQNLIVAENPDIVCLQESGNLYRMRSYDYPYKYVANVRDEIKTILNIFSKYPILNAEIINFPETKNNACYADILVDNDTVRVYNVHMQSLGISPGKGKIRNSTSQKLYKSLTAKFESQEEQAELVVKHSKSVSHKKIFCGDFNNNQYSRTYKIIKGENKDSFDECGSGFGRTFNFHGIPARIDFILTDPNFEVILHKTFDQKYSDHYPIMASFRLKKD